jgi:hypothetical protein
MVYPDNPLDETLTDKGNWKKEPKPINLNYVGDKIPDDAIVYKPFKIRGTGQIVDLAKQRLNERTRILNYKAERIEAGLYDYLTQNEIERAYQKQLAEIARLEALFSNGVLGLMFDNIKTKATNQFRSDYLQNDPDIVNFDNDSKTLAKETQDIADLQERNDKLFHEISTQTQQTEQQIIDNLRVAETIDKTEELGEIIDDLESVKSDLNSVSSIFSDAVFDDEGSSQSVMRRADEIINEDEIRLARDEERRLADVLEKTQERLNEISDLVEGKGMKKQLDRLSDNISTIKRYTELGERPVRMERRIRNIIRDAETGKPAKYATIRQQNIALEKFIKNIEREFEGVTIPKEGK